ncbi:MAG: helix-turn-helix domain-containing protein [Terriglobia bacterium]|jgi:predicted site-specific integrase-resolvase
MSPMTARRVLCARLGIEVSRATFYRWMQNGAIHTLKLVNRYYVTAAALEQFISEADWQESP